MTDHMGENVRYAARCESCGRIAEVRLKDDSTWCMDCHASALRLDYDDDLGTLLTTGQPVTAEELLDG